MSPHRVATTKRARRSVTPDLCNIFSLRTWPRASADRTQSTTAAAADGTRNFALRYRGQAQDGLVRITQSPCEAGSQIALAGEAEAADSRHCKRRAMEDDCWSIAALENVNRLAAAIVLKKGRLREEQLSKTAVMLAQKKETGMKLTTIILASAIALSSTFALAQSTSSRGK